MKNNINIKKLVKYIGNLLAILSVIFIINAMIKFKIDYTILLQRKMLFCIAILSIISSSSVFFDTLSGKFIINDVLQIKIPLKNMYKIYAKSNIAKYMPGNVMQYVSRGVYCKDYGVDTKDMYYITIMEILLKVISAFIVTILLVQNKINEIFMKAKLNININSIMIAGAFLLLLLGLFVYIYIKKRKPKESIVLEIRMIKSIISFIIEFFINALLFISVIYLIDINNINNYNIIFVIGIYTMAWLIGYITPGAPGGIGIKETIILVSLTPIYGNSIITLSVVIVRLINILGDIIAYLSSILIKSKEY